MVVYEEREREWEYKRGGDPWFFMRESGRKGEGGNGMNIRGDNSMGRGGESTRRRRRRKGGRGKGRERVKKRRKREGVTFNSQTETEPSSKPHQI